MDKTYCVILAGGSGTRFWPKSREKRPKQLCKIGHPEKTLIEQTLDRLDDFIPPSRRIIITHKNQIESTKEIVKDKCQHFIVEPEARNTAAALAVSSFYIQKLSGLDPDASMISLHADHIIKDVDKFKKTLTQSLQISQKGFVTLIGVNPSYPETGYGYIKTGEGLDNSGFKVSAFCEKPDLKTAKEYIQTKQYLWNTGLFSWQVSTILEEYKKLLPDMFEKLENFFKDTNLDFSSASCLENIYPTLQKIAIDNGIFEQSDNIAVVATDMDWQDVGSWEALYKISSKNSNNNVIEGPIHAVDTKNCIIDSDSFFVGTIGVQDLAIIVANKGILVCKRSEAQKAKQMVSHLQSGHVQFEKPYHDALD